MLVFTSIRYRQIKYPNVSIPTPSILSYQYLINRPGRSLWL